MDGQSEAERLEALGAGRPEAPGVAALAEARRRAGEPGEALRLAEEGLAAQPELVAARVSRALALLDLDRSGEARLELERILESVPDHPIASACAAEVPAAEPLPELAEAELDRALAHAEPETDQMLSADVFAEAAIQAAEHDDAEAEEGLVPVAPQGEPDPLYATATVAELLEEQGHGEEAAEIRRGLEPAAPAADEKDRGRVLPTLERWLDTLRRRDG